MRSAERVSPGLELIGAPEGADEKLDDAAELLRKAADCALAGDRDGAMDLLDAIRNLALASAGQEGIDGKDMWAVARVINLRSGIRVDVMAALSDILDAAKEAGHQGSRAALKGRVKVRQNTQ